MFLSRSSCTEWTASESLVAQRRPWGRVSAQCSWRINIRQGQCTGEQVMLNTEESAVRERCCFKLKSWIEVIDVQNDLRSMNIYIWNWRLRTTVDVRNQLCHLFRQHLIVADFTNQLEYSSRPVAIWYLTVLFNEKRNPQRKVCGAILPHLSIWTDQAETESWGQRTQSADLFTVAVVGRLAPSPHRAPEVSFGQCFVIYSTLSPCLASFIQIYLNKKRNVGE